MGDTDYRNAARIEKFIGNFVHVPLEKYNHLGGFIPVCIQDVKILSNISQWYDIGMARVYGPTLH